MLAGVCGTDPFRLMPVFLEEIKRLGFAGVQNFPTVGLIDGLFRQNLEELHSRGWLRYESTHNLNQVRLKDGLSAIEFLSAHFEQKEPNAKSEPVKENAELPLT